MKGLAHLNQVKGFSRPYFLIQICHIFNAQKVVPLALFLKCSVHNILVGIKRNPVRVFRLGKSKENAVPVFHQLEIFQVACRWHKISKKEITVAVQLIYSDLIGFPELVKYPGTFIKAFFQH